MVLHPPDRCVDTRGGLRPPPFPCQLCWDIFTCTRLNERKTDTYRATSVHSCCLQAVRTPQNTPLEEKHQLSAERDIVNQAPSSQWCSQTCINVRTGAGQGRGTWTRYTCTCIWRWTQKSLSQPWTITQYDYKYVRLIRLYSDTFTHMDTSANSCLLKWSRI